MKRGDLFLADLDPAKGSEQKGQRPVIILQNDFITLHTNTVIIIPITTNLKRSKLKSCVLLDQLSTGLAQDSVALCHQMRVIDKSRLITRIGDLSNKQIDEIEDCLLYTLGIILWSIYLFYHLLGVTYETT